MTLATTWQPDTRYLNPGAANPIGATFMLANRDAGAFFEQVPCSMLVVADYAAGLPDPSVVADDLLWRASMSNAEIIAQSTSEANTSTSGRAFAVALRPSPFRRMPQSGTRSGLATFGSIRGAKCYRVRHIGSLSDEVRDALLRISYMQHLRFFALDLLAISDPTPTETGWSEVLITSRKLTSYPRLTRGQRGILTDPDGY